MFRSYSCSIRLQRGDFLLSRFTIADLSHEIHQGYDNYRNQLRLWDYVLTMTI